MAFPCPDTPISPQLSSPCAGRVSLRLLLQTGQSRSCKTDAVGAAEALPASSLPCSQQGHRPLLHRQR